jgi:hypothetical protein
MQPTPASLEEILQRWPKEPRESARRLFEEYGPPAEFTASVLIWYGTRDGWKRTVLSKEEVPHRFPSPHTDFLEQFIDYRVPVACYSDLAAYDGSVVVDRTRGELSARCAGTSMNFVAVNLAHEIVEGRCDVGEARARYTELYQAYQKGEKPPDTQRFAFELPKGGTADPDVPTL